MEEFENWSDCEPDLRARVRMVLDVTDVLVSPSSVVTELCDVSSCCSDWEFVEPKSFSFSQKRVWAATQEEMMYEDCAFFKKKNGAAHTTAKFVFII